MWGAFKPAAVGLILVLFVAPGALAFTPALEVADEHTEHEGKIQDLEFDEGNGIVWSLSKDGGGLVGYDVDEGTVVAREQVETGHGLAVGDGVVYVASGHTLWSYDVDADELSQLAQLQDVVAGLAYDDQRDLVWTAGHQTVYAHDASNGSLIASHEEHTDGMSSIAVHGDYVVSGTTWQDEVVVWDVESEEVVWQPDFPEDVGKIGAVDFTDDGRLLVGTDAEDRSLVGMYDVDAREPLATYREHVFGVSGVDYHSTADVIVSTGLDNTVKFYDVAEGSLAAEYEHEDTIYTADLDEERNLLWFGDGEDQPGTVTGLDVSDQDEAPGSREADGSAADDGMPGDPSSGDAASGNESPLGLASLLAGVGLALTAARRAGDG